MSFIRNSALLCLILVAMPATVNAQSVAILGIETALDDAVANALSARLRVSARDLGWHVSPREVLLSQAEIANSCSRTHPTCLDQIASMLEVSELVFGTINRIMTADPTQFELEVQLYRYSRLEQRIILRYTGTIGPIPSEGAIDGFSDTAVAALSLPNESASADPPTTVDEDEPSDIPEPDRPVGGTHRAGESRLDLEFIGWPLIGLAAASFATSLGLVAVVDGFNRDPDYRAYRATVPESEREVCTSAANGMLYEPASAEAVARLDRARSICSDAPALEIAQVVLYVVSGLSAAVGGALIGYDLSLSPSVSADHAYLGVNGTF